MDILHHIVDFANLVCEVIPGVGHILLKNVTIDIPGMFGYLTLIGVSRGWE
jgi:hypothetical protein